MVARMITVTLTLPIRPKKVEDFKPLMTEMIKETASRPGFRSIKVFAPTSSTDKLLCMEEWESEADYMAYLAWRQETGATGGEAAAACFSGQPELAFWGEPFVASS